MILHYVVENTQSLDVDYSTDIREILIEACDDPQNVNTDDVRVRLAASLSDQGGFTDAVDHPTVFSCDLTVGILIAMLSQYPMNAHIDSIRLKGAENIVDCLLTDKGLNMAD